MPRAMRRRFRGRLPTSFQASQKTSDLCRCSHDPYKMALGREDSFPCTCVSCTPPPSSNSTPERFDQHTVYSNDENKRLLKQINFDSQWSKKSAKSILYANCMFDGNGIGQSGRILARTTKVSLMFRRWREYYWVHLYPAILVLFQSEEDFRVWKKMTSDDPAREKLVLWSINFDSMGFLEKKLKKESKKKGEHLQQEKNQIAGKEDVNKKDTEKKRDCLPSAVFKYAMMDMHSKIYGKKGQVIHAFKLERWSREGTGVTGAFGSADPQEVKALSKIIALCLTVTSRPGQKKGKKKRKRKKDDSSINTAPTTLSGRI